MLPHANGFQSVSKFQELVQIYSEKQIGLSHGNSYNLQLLSNSSLSARNRNEPRFRLLGIEAKAVIYIHTSEYLKRTRPNLVCCEAWWLRSNKVKPFPMVVLGSFKSSFCHRFYRRKKLLNLVHRQRFQGLCFRDLRLQFEVCVFKVFVFEVCVFSKFLRSVFSKSAAGVFEVCVRPQAGSQLG